MADLTTGQDTDIISPLGSKTSAGSVSVVIASDQAVIPFTYRDVPIAGTNDVVNAYTATIAAGVATTTSLQYTVTAAGTNATFLLKQVHCSGSGLIKAEVLVGPTAGLISKVVGFNSTANPNISFVFAQPIEVTASGTGIVKVIITNREPAATQDVYASVFGVES